MDNPFKAAYKRKIYLIERDFQINFILKFCTIVAIAGIFTVGIFYLFALRSTTVAIANSRVVVKSTADFMLPLLFQTVLVVMIFAAAAAAVVTLFVSHKIAGPLYRFKKVLQSLGTGDFSGDFSIRQRDQLHTLADALNEMIRNIRGEIKTLKEAFPAFKEKLDGISEHEVVENKRHLLAELKKVSEELNKTMRFFKA